ncbi:MAG TPA: NAD-dependent epimerase/dehydratase family protein, partial [Bacteroidia bacterium]|nr:NAD-dependent epimerase/dehydratase family protein [Bacteroidia bacterium]
ISVMPTNLYGPNDNFDLEKSHVLPALLRKMHLGKALENNNWEALRTDLNKLPIETINGNSSDIEIIEILNKYGISKKENKISIEIWGSGKPMREFLWSEDMADACVFLMENINFSDVVNQISNSNTNCGITEHKATEVRNAHINIGTGKEISIKELALTIKKKVGFTGELYFNTNKPDGTLRKLTDPSKLHQLGWKHTVELEEGIGNMYEWYINQ